MSDPFYCPNCGKNISKKQKYCHLCGTQIYISNTTTNQSMRINDISKARQHRNPQLEPIFNTSQNKADYTDNVINTYDVTDQDHRDLSKALGLAGASMVGIIVPVVGWVLAGMSLSFIKNIPKNSKTKNKIKQIKRAAYAGIIFSCISVSIWSWYYRSQAQENFTSSESQSASNENADELSTNESTPSQDKTSFDNLVVCLDGVDKWFNDNVGNQPYIDQQQSLLKQKAQFIDECAVKYPTNFINDTDSSGRLGCIEATDKWFSENAGNQQTIAQQQLLLEQKQVYVAECQLRYRSG